MVVVCLLYVCVDFQMDKELRALVKEELRLDEKRFVFALVDVSNSWLFNNERITKPPTQ